MEFDYEKYQNDELRKGGFNPDELTQEQKNIILQPSEAPENYYMDGEISSKQAFQYWYERLKKSGLSIYLVERAVDLNFN